MAISKARLLWALALIVGLIALATMARHDLTRDPRPHMEVR